MTSIADICEVIEKWVSENHEEEKEVQFVGSFIVMDPEKDFEVIDSRIFAYGFKDILQIALDGLKEAVNDEEEDFVNW